MFDLASQKAITILPFFTYFLGAAFRKPAAKNTLMVTT